MRPLFLLAAVVAFSLVPVAGRSQERDEDGCFRLSPGIQAPVQVAACTSDISGSERALKAALAELRAQVPTEDRPDLDKAERAWTAYRDAQCRWEAGGNPGSTGHSSAIIACTADMNRKRAKYLRDDLKDRW